MTDLVSVYGHQDADHDLSDKNSQQQQRVLWHKTQAPLMLLLLLLLSADIVFKIQFLSFISRNSRSVDLGYFKRRV